jgi:hypothetical protein
MDRPLGVSLFEDFTPVLLDGGIKKPPLGGLNLNDKYINQYLFTNTNTTCLI